MIDFDVAYSRDARIFVLHLRLQPMIYVELELVVHPLSIHLDVLD